MSSTFVVLPEADSSDEEAYNCTACSYEWKSLKAPTLKGFLLRLVVLITRSPLWGVFYAFFARRSGIFKVCLCCTELLPLSPPTYCYHGLLDMLSGPELRIMPVWNLNRLWDTLCVLVGGHHVCLQALKETAIPEQAIYRAPADPGYCKIDCELCKQLTGADPVQLGDAKDRFTALPECIGDGSTAPLAPGPTIQDYNSAYTSVRVQILSAAAGAAVACYTLSECSNDAVTRCTVSKLSVTSQPH